MYKIFKTAKRVVHAIAHCDNCDFTEDLYSSAAWEATKHAKATGHTVSVEQGVHYKVKKI